ncbi:MAG: AAA family ATPase [Ktedonobacteraceae bacterium]|nr:AAA family ATPase [Ktedonobacteraceae bacterium]
MKISIRNLGAVREAEIDLKPLTVFVGPNSTGKTWTAYVLSGIFGPYGFRNYLNESNIDHILDEYPVLNEIFQQVNSRKSANINLIEFTDQYGEAHLNKVIAYAKEWMPRFLGTNRCVFDELIVSIHLAEAKGKLLETLRREVFTRSLSSTRSLKEKDQELMYFYSESDNTEENIAEVKTSQDLPSSVVKRFLLESVFQPMHRSLFPDTYVFPTERPGFVTFPLDRTFVSKDPVQRAVSSSGELLDQSSDVTKDPVVIVPVAIPIYTFYRMISKVYTLSARTSLLRGSAATKEYTRLAQLLEKEILSGGVQFSAPEPQLGRELLFRTTNDINLEIPVASSMVKEITPLVLYLRYLARLGDLLVIDEPEMNLHPAAQVRMIEFLALLVNAGLNVLITTHSSYMVDHLANLMKAAATNNPKKYENLFFLERTEAFIPQDQVSVYLFQDGTATSILSAEGEINWRTFSNVSDKISDIFFALPLPEEDEVADA